MILSIILAVIIALIPLGIRLMAGAGYIGDESYYHMSVVEHIKEGKSVSDIRADAKNLIGSYDLFIFALSLLIGDFSFILAPIITGLLMALCLYFILVKMKAKPAYLLTVMLFFLLSPIFIYSSSVVNAMSFYAAVSLLAFYLMLSKRKFDNWLSLLLYLSVGLSSITALIINLGILGGYASYNPKQRKIASAFLITLLLISAGYWTYAASTGIPDIPNFSARNVIQDYFSDLGGLISFSTFAVMLFFFGIYYIWERKSKPILFICLLIFLISLLSDQANIFLNIFVACISAYAFLNFVQRKWSSEAMKKIIIAALILGILLSSYTYCSFLVKEVPNKEIIQGLEFLEEQEKGVVLSHYSRGHIIRQISGNNVLMDSDVYNYYNINELYNASDTMFHSFTLTETKALLEEHDIRYIFIDSDMKNEIWKGPEDGLLYLFRNNETFKNIYRQNGIEIWEVI